MIPLYEKLKAARKEKGLTQEQVASTLNLKQITVSGYERGYRRPDTDTLTKLASLYECSTDYLLSLPTGAVDSHEDFSPYLAPIVGTVRPGVDKPAFTEFEGYKLVDLHTIAGERDDIFWLRAKDDSMSGDFIGHHDLLCISCRQEAISGSIVLVAVGDSAAIVRRLIKKDDRIILQPSNPAYFPDVYMGEEMNLVKPIGRVVESRRDFMKT